MNREDLKQYTHIQEWIKDRIEYLEEYKDNINRLTAVTSLVTSGNTVSTDRMAEKLSNLMDFRDELMQKIKEQEERKNKILAYLEEMEQPYQNMLFKIYIQGKSLVEVADELAYNYKYLSRIHQIALKKFDEIANR